MERKFNSKRFDAFMNSFGATTGYKVINNRDGTKTMRIFPIFRKPQTLKQSAKEI